MSTHRWSGRLLSIVLLGFFALATVVGVAVATHRAAFIVTHGVSMNPVYYQGDLVVVARSDRYQVGDIVAYRVPAKNIVVLHRIIGVDADGFVLKGDNNQSIDPTHPGQNRIVGRAVIHVAQGGRWLQRIGSPPALALAATALAVGGGGAVHTSRRRRRRLMSRHASPGRRPAGRRTLALHPRLRPAFLALAALTGIGILLAGLAWHVAPQTMVRPAPQNDRQLSFGYTTTVHQTPAYDGITVHSPDPVFRRLSNTVDVQLNYRATSIIPSTMTVIAELSAASGWHSDIVLSGPQAFTAQAYTSTVRLNLTSLDARARAAAAATGIAGGPVTVTLRATVRAPGRPDFRPSLVFTLTPLQLSLAGGPAGLTVADAPRPSAVQAVPATLKFLDLRIAVSRARTDARVLLLAALLAAVALALVARSTAPATEGEEIRRRYGPLLAAVQPITSHTQLPLVDVTSFSTLAQLAERSGQLVLHWSRSGIDTFLVRDDGTTYRYRTGDRPNDGRWAGDSRSPASAGLTELNDLLAPGGQSYQS